MKTIKVILLILVSTVSVGQIRFKDKEYFNFTVAIDPSATIKASSPNLYAKLELVAKWGYVNVNAQVLPDLLGGYFDYGGTMGLNLTFDTFDTTRAYAGIRLGTIKRGNESYPLFGFESGIEYNINESYAIGLRATYDYRSDFLYSGADPSYRGIGYVTFSKKF